MKNFKLRPCGINDAVLYVTEYDKGALKGWLTHPHLQGPKEIANITQMLFLLEDALDKEESFFDSPDMLPFKRDGKEPIATIRLQLLGQDHHTWQGVVVWEDHQVSAPFFSVLEMIQILDEILDDLSA